MHVFLTSFGFNYKKENSYSCHGLNFFMITEVFINRMALIFITFS